MAPPSPPPLSVSSKPPISGKPTTSSASHTLHHKDPSAEALTKKIQVYKDNQTDASKSRPVRGSPSRLDQKQSRQQQQLQLQLQQQQQDEADAQRLEDNDVDEAGYKKMAKIGEGTYGEVFRGLCKKTNASVALKRIQLNISHGGVPTTAIREVALLKEIQHNNVIRLVDLIYFDTIIYLVFDYCDVDLRKYMDEVGRQGLTLKHIKSFSHQLLRGLHYCHSHRILHRDLKPQNLLIDSTGKLTIADLGLSRAFGVPMRTYTHQVITLWYRAPEILLGSPHYSTAVDMWSVGCILAEMFTLKPLFPGDSQIDELFRIFRVLGTPTEEMWPGVSALPDFHVTFPPWRPADLKERLARTKYPTDVNDHALDLLKSLLVYDPYSRISARKAEEHPFFYDDLSMLKF